MKILYLIDNLDTGGAEQILAALAPRLVARGMDVRVAMLSRSGGEKLSAKLRQGGVPVDRIPFRRLLDPKHWLALRRYIETHVPDIVHTQLERADIAGLFLASQSGIGTITTLHTMDPLAPLDRAELRRRLERWFIVRYADRIVCVSRALMKHLRDIHRFPEDRLVVQHNGVDVRAHAAVSRGERDAVRSMLGLASGAVVLLTVAVLRRPKGIEFMLRAMLDLRSTLPMVQYLVVGEGPDRKRLEDLAHALGIARQVIFAGARSDVPALLGAADIFVLPSLAEALPTVVAEASAAGLPVVATSVGGTPEIIVPGETGLLVAPGDPAALVLACRGLLENADLRGQMGESARRHASAHFDIDRQVDGLIRLYGETARGRAACV